MVRNEKSRLQSAKSCAKCSKFLIFRERRYVVGNKSRLLWKKMYQLLQTVVLFKENSLDQNETLRATESEQQHTENESSVSSSSTNFDGELSSFTPEQQTIATEDKYDPYPRLLAERAVDELKSFSNLLLHRRTFEREKPKEKIEVSF